MSAFYDRKYDVLLSTTIVESGLDIPSANTLIVHRADRFGLAQLYQLRGRVGRAKTRAYAYLTMPADRSITEAAEKRLQVLANLDSLGAGFQLASHDLDIRGAGNLLGDEQSGHIKEVGFELYQSMLEDAILELKAGGVPRTRGILAADQRRRADPDPRSLCPRPRPAHGPLSPARRARGPPRDRRVRRRADRPLRRRCPRRPRTCCKIVEMKLNCRAAMIAKLDIGAKGAVVTFADGGFPDLDGLLGLHRAAEGRGQAPPRQQAVGQPRLADARSAAERRAADCRAAWRGWPRPASRRRSWRRPRPASASMRRRTASALPRRARRRRGSPGKGRSPSRRAAPAGRCFRRLRRPPSGRVRGPSAIIALTTIRSRLPPTMSAIRPRSIFNMSSGRLVR